MPPEAEYGWERWDDALDKFRYVGAWNRVTYRGYNNYNSTWIESRRAGDYVEFETTFRRIRIYAYGNNDTSGFEVTVDGVSYGIFKTCYAKSDVVLVCELDNLKPGKNETVRLTILRNSSFPNSTVTRLLFDAIDVYKDDKLALIQSNENYYKFNKETGGFTNLGHADTTSDKKDELFKSNGLLNLDLKGLNRTKLSRLEDNDLKVHVYRYKYHEEAVDAQ